MIKRIFVLFITVVLSNSVSYALKITTIAGNGSVGFSGDGGLATSTALYHPLGVYKDNSGNLYIADGDNNRIRKVDAATGIITTVAGNGSASYSGDGGLATSASLRTPSGVSLDSAGNMYIADYNNHRIRKVDAATGIITTVAGTGTAGFSGDGGPATSASLYLPHGLCLDSAENIYIEDHLNHRIRKVNGTTGVITTVAGNGIATFSGDGGPAISASLRSPSGVYVDSAGNIYIADRDNQRIRKVDGSTGIITTVVGNGSANYSGDGGLATSASLNGPAGVRIDSAGNLYIAEFYNQRIRKVDGTTGIISTVAGTGSAGFSGDGGQSTSASLNFPSELFLDSANNIYIADYNNHRIREVIINNTPVAVDDSYDTDRDTVLTIVTDVGVLANDTDADGDMLSAILVGDVKNGTLAMNGDGSFTYTPNANFIGNDSFTYKANDGKADSNEATVSITVNTALKSDLVIGNVGVFGINGNVGMLFNDGNGNFNLNTIQMNSQGTSHEIAVGDFNNDSLDDIAVTQSTGQVFVALGSFSDGLQNSDLIQVGTVTDTFNRARVPEAVDLNNDGNLDIVISEWGFFSVLLGNGDGTFGLEIQSPAGYADCRSIALGDLNGDGKMDLVGSIAAGNWLVVVYLGNGDGSFSNGVVIPNSALAIPNLKLADMDADGDLDIVSGSTEGRFKIFINNGSANFTLTNVGLGSSGAYVLIADDLNGDDNPDVITTTNLGNGAVVRVIISDGNGGFLVPTELGPFSNQPSFAVIVDANGDALKDIAMVIAGAPNGSVLILPGNGDGTFGIPYSVSTYGSSYSIGAGNFNPPINNTAPIAVDDSYNSGEDSVLTIAAADGVLANDTDANGDTLTAILVNTTVNGTLTLNGDGSFTYTPNASFIGSDNFTYNANDGTDISNVATVTITVNVVNKAPVINQYVLRDDFDDGVIDSNQWEYVTANIDPPAEMNGVLTLDYGSFQTLSPLEPTPKNPLTIEFDVQLESANNSKLFISRVSDDPIANPFVQTGFKYENGAISPLAAIDVITVDNPLDTSELPMSEGEFYHVRLTDNGDIITLSVNDQVLISFENSLNPASNFIRIDGPNFSIDNLSIIQSESINDVTVNEYANEFDIDLTNVFSDPDGDALELSVNSSVPSLVTASLLNNQTLTLSFIDNQYGNADITVTASDGELSVSDTFSVTVNSVNSDPTAYWDPVHTDEDSSVVIPEAYVLLNDVDVDDNDVLTVTGIAPTPEFGATTIGSAVFANGEITYNPNCQFDSLSEGELAGDTFYYTVSDGHGGLATGKVTVTIQGVDDAPVAGMSVNVLEDVPTSIVLSATDVDDDTDFTFTITSQPQHGQLIGTVANLTYHPNLDFSGTDSFTYNANYGDSEIVEGTVIINVIAVNDSPTFQMNKSEIHVMNNAGAQTLNNIIKAISPGSIYETDQTVTFSVLTDAHSLFTASGAPSIDSNGVLRFEPVSNAVGTADVSITLFDNGGTENGGSNSSQHHQLFIHIESSDTAIVLLNSSGIGIPGATAEYYDGTNWVALLGETDSIGKLDVPDELSGNVKFRLAYNNTTQTVTQNLNNAKTVLFQTVGVTVKLVDSTGTNITSEAGTIAFNRGGWQFFGNTGTSGFATYEMLPGSYNFRMTYGNSRQTISQAIQTNPVVIFKTKPVYVSLKDSQGNSLTDQTEFTYSGIQLLAFTGETQTNGSILKELLPATYRFRAKYENATVELRQNIDQNPNVVFQTKQVTISLYNASGSLITDGTARYEYNSNGWNDLGISDTGQMTVELLPKTYNFRIEHKSTKKEKSQNTVFNSDIEFKTVNFTLELKDSTNAYIPNANADGNGIAQFNSGGWQNIGDTVSGSIGIELLPNLYTFRMTYANASIDLKNDLFQDTVTFNTEKIEVELRNSQDELIVNTGVDDKVQYSSNGWQEFGALVNGVAVKELLPKVYSFRMNYAKASNEMKNDDFNPLLVKFNTSNVIVQLLDSAGFLLEEPFTVQYNSGGWQNFGSSNTGQVSLELLPKTYSIRMNFKGKTVSKNVVVIEPETVVDYRTGRVYSLSESVIQVNSGGWISFNQNMELLSGNYKFKYIDNHQTTYAIEAGYINEID